MIYAEMEQNLKSTFWRDAAKAGGVAGVALAILMLIMNTLQARGASVGVISHWLEFFIMFVSIYWFGKVRAAKYGRDGFTYGQSVGYTAAMMLFAGFLYGLGMFLVLKNPAQTQSLIDSTAAVSTAISGAAPDQTTLDMMRSMYRSPLLYVFGGILYTVAYGVFVSLFLSVFIKTPRTR